MEFTVHEIAKYINGVVEKSTAETITDFKKIEEATAGSIVVLAKPQYETYLENSPASAFILPNDYQLNTPTTKSIIRVNNPYLSFAQLIELFYPDHEEEVGISGFTNIHPSAKVSEEVFIGDFVSLGKNVKLSPKCKIYSHTSIGDDVVIGENTVIHSGVNIYKQCKIGSNCIIHSGVAIGSDGFGFSPNSDGYYKIPQVGNVIIQDMVEIGANTCIDRATMGSTIIHEGVKLDNLIQIAHNVEIGKNTVIAAQCGIAGSTKIGKNCMIGGQVGIIGHLKIGNYVKIEAQSGVQKDIPDHGIVQGSPAFDIQSFKRSYVHFKNLGKK